MDELPPTLDEIYNRILLEIPAQYHHEARVVFSLLAFSIRPISLGEAAEAVAIDPEKGKFDRRNRLFDPGSILKICSTLISVSHFKPNMRYVDNTALAMNDESKELRFAHYSIKEYLVSKRAPTAF